MTDILSNLKLGRAWNAPLIVGEQKHLKHKKTRSLERVFKRNNMLLI